MKALMFVLGIFFSLEAKVSEVFYESNGVSLEELVATAKVIVMVNKQIPKAEVFKTKTFSRETHFKKESETNYSESLQIYSGGTVLKGNLTPSALVKVWEAPDYNESYYRSLHENNLSSSPIVKKYQPTAVAKTGDSKILFLKEMIGHSEIYELVGAEGIKSLPKVKTFIKKQIGKKYESKTLQRNN